jgi:cell division protein FtsB
MRQTYGFSHRTWQNKSASRARPEPVLLFSLQVTAETGESIAVFEAKEYIIRSRMLPKTNNKYLEKLKPFMDVRVLGLILFGIIVLLVSWSGLSVLQNNYKLEKELARLKQQTSVQQLENENLKLKNQYYVSDQYLELSARRQFDKAAPGESVYLIPASVALSKTIDIPKEQQTALPIAPKARPKYRQNIDDWIDFLLHKNR